MEKICLYKVPNHSMNLQSNLPFFELTYGRKITLIPHHHDYLDPSPSPLSAREATSKVCIPKRPSSGSCLGNNKRCDLEEIESYCSSEKENEQSLRKIMIVPGFVLPCEPPLEFEQVINKYRPLVAEFHKYKRLNRRRVIGVIVTLFLSIRRGDNVTTPKELFSQRSRMFRSQEQICMVTDGVEFEEFLRSNESVREDGEPNLEGFVYSKKKEGWRRRGEKLL